MVVFPCDCMKICIIFILVKNKKDELFWNFVISMTLIVNVKNFSISIWDHSFGYADRFLSFFFFFNIASVFKKNHIVDFYKLNFRTKCYFKVFGLLFFYCTVPILKLLASSYNFYNKKIAFSNYLSSNLIKFISKKQSRL